MTAGDVSPPLNAFEVSTMVDSPCPRVDAFRVDIAPEPRAVKMVTALAEACDRTSDPDMIGGLLNEPSWSLLDATLRAAPHLALTRAAALAHRHGDSLCPDRRRVLQAVQDHAGLVVL